MSKIIDLRSDTVTKPSNKMRDFMIKAKVGDDVYGEDPTVNELERKAAKMTNKESAIFISSGTQANLLALLSHCERGDEYICGQDAHIYKYEAGGAAVLGSIQPQPIEFENDATLDFDLIENKIKPKDSHFANTKTLCLENTHNGKVLSLEYLKKVNTFASKNNLTTHLDGARVFNAVVSLDADIKDISKHFDSMSICLSKGLGAPVGSLLVGSKEIISKARRYRKMLGGGMRQAGILAAAGIFCLDNNIDDLKLDHKKAKLLKKSLSEIPEITIISNDTNMLFIKVDNKIENKLLKFLEKNNVLISGYGKLRIVTHRDISINDIEKVSALFKTFFQKIN